VLALMLVQGTTLAAKLKASEVDTATGSGEYRLAPGDKLSVIVFDQPQLSGDFTIDGNGEILLPLGNATSRSASLVRA
jgi:protein involved in polysaccharide export with SLBB domain